MKILLLGKDGQVGRELQRTLSSLGELISVGRSQVDLTNLDSVQSFIRLHRPSIIVNAAAYTAVDKAEIESEKAYMINELATKILAEEATKLNAWLVHYSTDYVFDGKKNTPYIETDQASPLNIYGQTKLAGEKAIQHSGCKHLIFRSSWIYSSHGSNFPLAILRRAAENDHIDVVSDNIGCPTSASMIANITAQIIYRIKWDCSLATSSGGIYHLVASGKTSWYEYAKFLIDMAQKKGLPTKTVSNKVFPISAEKYQCIAKRPKNSQLDNRKLSDTFGLTLPQWEAQVESFVNELANNRFILK